MFELPKKMAFSDASRISTANAMRSAQSRTNGGFETNTYPKKRKVVLPMEKYLEYL
jgi:hypothetical protein